MSRFPTLSICLSVVLIALAPMTASARPVSDVVIKPSTRSVKETIDALAQAVEAAGAKVVARVDHAAGAKAVGADMKPAEVLIFGNPKLGTPLIQANPRAGLDLPMKVLAYEDASGKVWIVTTRPSALKARYGIKGRDDVITAMSGALDKLTGAAAGAVAPAATPVAPAAPANSAPSKK
jgi:uncharacterized protein (DUF302 family)